MRTEYKHVEGHADHCLAHYDPMLCDCEFRTKRIRRDAFSSSHVHEWTGFRDAKVCRGCGISKRELKSLR